MNSLFNSQLHDEKTFYQAFLKDLKNCQNEIIVESPYITSSRMQIFYSIFQDLLAKDVKIYIVTKDLADLDEPLRSQSLEEIKRFEVMGIQPLLCIGNHHRKLAILDRKILWEGSLNILSQTQSREIMRRIECKEAASQMFDFLRYSRFI